MLIKQSLGNRNKDGIILSLKKIKGVCNMKYAIKTRYISIGFDSKCFAISHRILKTFSRTYGYQIELGWFYVIFKKGKII